MKYQILIPQNAVSGGPELAHQLCAAINDFGQSAIMYYYAFDNYLPQDVEAPERYKRYGTRHIVNMSVYEAEQVLIHNEMSTAYLKVIPCKKKYLYWMSVDNYLNCHLKEPIEVLREEIDLHLVQSYYAKAYLLENGIPEEKIIEVSDFISDIYGSKSFPNEYRQNVALYNPRKGYADLKPIIDSTPFLRWIPLSGFTENDLVVLMSTAKVYVDFGPHPGKDRIPREAAACGACIITNKKGSAAFQEDVPIPEMYKFKDTADQKAEIINLLADIVTNFDDHTKRFESYRESIQEEKKIFRNQVKRMIEI